MLHSLHIENYALIQQSDITFEDGFIVITGETGAGKSILLGALGLLLGNRADTAVLADKERKCIVEAQFDIAGLGLEPLFAEADIDYDDRLILRREITPAAKSRAFINDTPVQLPFLRQIGSRLVDIHSQHETLTLANSSFRLALLDTIADSSPLPDYRKAYDEYADAKHRLEELTSAEAENRKEQDYLQFQYNELAEAHLIDGEQEALEQESALLSHAESVQEGLSIATSLFDDDTDLSILARLRQTKSSLSHIAPFHPDIEALLQRVDSSLIELDDINDSLGALANTISYDPARQQQVDERLALIYRLQKKHGCDTVAALIAVRDDIDARLQNIASLDDRIHQLMEQVDRSFSRLQQVADSLTASRRSSAQLLAQHIIPTLHDLGMPEARLEVQLSPAPSYGPQGHDSVAFLFSANRGADLRDLARVASGGELSRLMLAIKSMLTTHRLLPTVIFDEIDTGVSGDISVAVGRIMQRMAQRMQVIAITHMPQIAARAAQHLKVYKHLDDDRTVSRIRQLSTPDRITEVAVMLSSDPPTPAALQTAKELME